MTRHIVRTTGRARAWNRCPGRRGRRAQRERGGKEAEETGRDTEKTDKDAANTSGEGADEAKRELNK
jgi:hypothetical protein